jgi:hypothetical protein
MKAVLPEPTICAAARVGGKGKIAVSRMVVNRMKRAARVAADFESWNVGIGPPKWCAKSCRIGSDARGETPQW